MANTMRSTDRNGLVPRHRSRHLCDAPDPRSWPENVCTVLNFIQQHRDHEGNSNKDSFSNWETEFCAQTSLPLEPAEYDLLIELLQLTDTDDVTDLKAKAQTQAQNVVEDFDVDALDDVPPETTGKSRALASMFPFPFTFLPLSVVRAIFASACCPDKTAHPESCLL